MKFLTKLLTALGALSLNVAFASTAAAGKPHDDSFLGMLPMLIIFVVVFYFLLIRPQSKRAKQQRALIQGTKEGDEIVTTGGIVGMITKIEDSFIHLQVASGMVIKMQRASVASVLPKGSVDAAAPADTKTAAEKSAE